MTRKKYTWKKDPHRSKKPKLTPEKRKQRLLTNIQLTLKNESLIKTFPWIEEILRKKEQKLKES